VRNDRGVAPMSGTMLKSSNASSSRQSSPMRGVRHETGVAAVTEVLA